MVAYKMVLDNIVWTIILWCGQYGIEENNSIYTQMYNMYKICIIMYNTYNNIIYYYNIIWTIWGGQYSKKSGQNGIRIKRYG